MPRLSKFLKATLLGGVLVLAPLALLGYLAVSAVTLAMGVVEPLFAWLPYKSVAGVSLTVLAALAALLALCFAAGLVAEVTLIRRLVKGAETLVLSRLPGYSLMKNVGESLVGMEGRDGRRPVLVCFDVGQQIGFLMDTLADGRRIVFVPHVPNAMSGALHVLGDDRLESLPVTIPVALDGLGRLGVGLGEALSRTPNPASLEIPTRRG